MWNYHPSWYPSLNPCLDATCLLIFDSIFRQFYFLTIISGMCPLLVSCLRCASPGTDLALTACPCRQVVVLLEYECDCHSMGPMALHFKLMCLRVAAGLPETRPGFLPLVPSYPKALLDSAILTALRSPQRLGCFSPLHRLLPVSCCLASPYL